MKASKASKAQGSVGASNVVRSDTIERALDYRTLHERHGFTHEAIAEIAGVNRTTVCHMIRLTKLSGAVLALLESGKLRLGHGKALLSIADKRTQTKFANRALCGKWTVRQLEDELRNRRNKLSAPPVNRDAYPAQKHVDRMAAALRVKVANRTHRRRPQGGFIEIEYRDQSELKRIITQLNAGLGTGK